MFPFVLFLFSFVAVTVFLSGEHRSSYCSPGQAFLYLYVSLPENYFLGSYDLTVYRGVSTPPFCREVLPAFSE